MHEASRIPAGPRGVFLGPWASLPAVLEVPTVRHPLPVRAAGYEQFRSLNPRVGQ